MGDHAQAAHQGAQRAWWSSVPGCWSTARWNLRSRSISGHVNRWMSWEIHGGFSMEILPQKKHWVWTGNNRILWVKHMGLWTWLSMFGFDYNKLVGTMLIGWVFAETTHGYLMTRSWVVQSHWSCLMDLEKKLIHLEPDKFFHWAMKKWKCLIPSHYINSDSHY